MSIPFGELNMRDPGHVAWAQSQRDPELWHACSIAILNYLGDPHGFLVWMTLQPETDRATAGYVFFGGDGWEYLRGRNDHWRHHNGLSEQQWLNAMRAICRRAAARRFASDVLGLPPGVEASRQTCLEVVRRGEVVPGAYVPRALLERPFPQERPLRYFVEDGAVVE
jgi:hypothetical protein